MIKKFLFLCLVIPVIVVGILGATNKSEETTVNFEEKEKINIEEEANSLILFEVDVEEFDFGKFSLEECKEIYKSVIGAQYKSEDTYLIALANRIDELIFVKQYYEEISKCLNHIKKDATFEEQKEIYYKTPEEIVLELCDSNNDWSLLRISNEFYEKMRENKGIIGESGITNYYLRKEPPYNLGKINLIYEKGEEKIELIIEEDRTRVYADIDSYGSEIIKEFIIEETIYHTNKEGEELDTKKKFTDENTKSNFEELCKDGEVKKGSGNKNGELYGFYGDDIAVSENFRNKYETFLDIFIHYSPLEYNEIELKEIDIENKEAVFEVDSILEFIKRNYKIKYTLDNNLYLDDIIIIEKNEEKYNGERIAEGAATYYYNSDWSKLKLSENFRNKFNNKQGITPNEILIDTNDFCESISLGKGKSIRLEYTKDGNKSFYFCKFYYDNQENLDDVIYEKLPYDTSMTIEEVKEAYLKDYSERLGNSDFYNLTLEEAIDYSDDKNPLDLMIFYKKKNGKIDASYGENVGFNPDRYYFELENIISNKENKIQKDEKSVFKEANKYKLDFVKEYISSNIIKVVLIIMCLIGLFIGLIIFKNKIVVIVSSVILVVILLSLNLVNFFNGISGKNEIVKYISNDNIKETIAIKKPFYLENADGNLKEFIYITEEEYINKMCNRKYDISKAINDYILKAYYCVSKKAQNKKLDYDEIKKIFDFNEIKKENEYVEKEYLLDRINLQNKSPFNYKINEKNLTFEEMEFMYENIKYKDIDNFKSGFFVNELISEIRKKIKYIEPKDYNNKNILLSNYITRQINLNAICENFFEDEIMLELKDWYIEDSKQIKLPLGVILNFEKQEFIKKDIKKIICADKDDNNDLIFYYKDSSDNIHGDFVLNDYIDENDKFNRTELIYDIKRAKITFNVKNFKP